MHEGLFRLVASIHDRKTTKSFLGELLTSTEMIMIAKRLAGLVMLCRGYSGYKVRMVLKVSPSTVIRLREQLDSGAFPYLETAFRGNRKKRETEDFFDVLYKFILMGMPPRVAKGRWKYVFKD